MLGQVEDKIIRCRVCTGELEEVLDLGRLYPSNFTEGDDTDKEKYPLCLCKCIKCDLVQLKESAPMDMMYRQYWYKSSLNKSMVVALQDVVDDIICKVKLEEDDVVIDTGCNDGTMLAMYPDWLHKIGFDPALNLGEECAKNCDYFVNDYFDTWKYPIEKKAKVITSIAMFYDLPYPNKFVGQIRESLDKDGIWVVQFTDLLSMFKINAFDNICHEHLEYYSLSVLESIFTIYGLEIFDVSYNMVNGGSIRASICHKGSYPISNDVTEFMSREQKYMEFFDDPFAAFAERVDNIKEKIVSFVKGKSVDVLGASTKGNTLLQYFGLDNSDIRFAGEINKDKFGLSTVGTNIPIEDEQYTLYSNAADYCLILPWHFIDNFLESKKEYLYNGGKFIVPMPEPAVYSMKCTSKEREAGTWGTIVKELL